MTSKNDTYWLLDDGESAVDFLEDYHSRWSLWSASPFRQAWLRNYLAYYSPVINPSSWDTSLIFEGVQGELTRFYTPKARTYIRQLVTIATKNRLAVQCMAQTTGADVVQDVKLGNALADQIIQNERLDVKSEQLVEGALVCGAWFTKTTWRTDKGQPYTRDQNGNVIYTGGVEITTPAIFDVFYDISPAHWEELSWAECRTMKNRWDLLAQHPELKDEILALPSVREVRGPNTWFDRTLPDEDLVFVYEMYARPSPALPQGRMLIYSSGECIFYDGENPYGTIPIEPMIPESVMSTGLGYPQFTNLVAAQEMYDNSLSAIATNQAQFAVQSVAIARGANVNVQELNGMRFVAFTPQNVPGGGKPEPLQLSQTAPETFKFSDLLDKVMMDMSGINGALRGSPPPGVTSGVAIATLSANALELTSSVTKAYQLCMEKTIMHALNAFKKFAKLPQVVTLQGRNNQVSNEEFTGDQVSNISAVKLSMLNPVMQTVAGRLEIAEKLLQMPRDLWPDYIAVLEGRPLTDLTKNAVSQFDLIEEENKLLMKGAKAFALSTDDHPKHIQEHAALLNDPAVRLNGPTVQVILDHILEHQQLAQSTDPMLMAMVRTGKQPQMMPEQAAPGPRPAPEGNQPQMPGAPAAEASRPAKDMLDRG